MKYLLGFILFLLFFVSAANGQPQLLIGFEEHTHAMALKEVQYKPGMGTPYSEAFYQISTGGPENSLIGNRIEEFSDRTEKYTAQCVFLVVNIPTLFQGNPYRVVSCSLTTYLQNGSRVPGYSYTVGMLNPGDVIIKSSVSQYTQAEKIANRGAVMGMSGTTASYTETIVLPDIKSYITPGGQTIIGIKAEGQNPMSAQIGFCALTLMVEPIVYSTVNVANNFSGGKIRAKADSPSGTDQNAPVAIYDETGKTVYISAVDNNNYDGTYYRIFNDSEASQNPSEWWKYNADLVKQTGTISSASTSFVLSTEQNNWKYEAQMKKLCDVSVGITSGSGSVNGSLSVDNTTRSVPYSTQKVEGNNITVSIVNTTFSVGAGTYLEYTFDHWIVDGASYSTSTSITLNVSAHKSIQAYYKAKPINGYRNQNYSSTEGQPIIVYWNEHPSSGVTAYYIYRTIKDLQSETLIGTVNRGTTSYTDTECAYTSGYSDNLIHYDVRAYYQPDNAYANADYIAIFGDYGGVHGDPNIVQGKGAVIAACIVPTEYQLSAYPNPFNPTTVIRYSMPEAGEVSLKVYNLLSQEVASLVSETKSAGVHTVNFNANNLPSGIYIARLQAGSKVMSAKLQLIK